MFFFLNCIFKERVKHPACPACHNGLLTDLLHQHYTNVFKIKLVLNMIGNVMLLLTLLYHTRVTLCGFSPIPAPSRSAR